MQEDRPQTILQTQNSVESISITVVLPARLFPLRDVCPRYRHDYRGITVVAITVQLSKLYPGSTCINMHKRHTRTRRVSCVTAAIDKLVGLLVGQLACFVL